MREGELGARQPDLNKVEGWLWPQEGRRLLWLAQRVPAGQCIVEVGSYAGKSAAYLARGSRRGNRVPVHCHDLWADGDLHARFRATTAPYRPLIVEHRGDSAAAGLEWDGPPVGLLWIDGDHSYDGVRADIAAWVPHVAAGGWVAFHDYNAAGVDGLPPPKEGVIEAVDEWLATIRPRDVTRNKRVLAVRL